VNVGAGKGLPTDGPRSLDTFVFDAAIKPKIAAKANADLILDYIPAVDTIELVKTVVTIRIVRRPPE